LSFVRVGYDAVVMNQVKSNVLSLVRSDLP